ncbi:MAG: copper resistance protein NlpE N-terminal domain-containing protein [Saprospiraceae bacterium]|nr:copper resistance protein NlpE N-terminal domain-containing protein [Saprospiraceae bacterium]
MKTLFFACFSILALFSCQEGAKKTPDTKAVTTDSSAIANEEAMAAFYHGALPCPDCDEILTMLTLNADEQRTFTLQEEFKGKESRTVESTGTWTVDGDVLTLNQKSGPSKYQITDDGVVSLNADGSKRDSESAKKYLLKRVLGE